jgi:hypothetical protein
VSEDGKAFARDVANDRLAHAASADYANGFDRCHGHRFSVARAPRNPIPDPGVIIASA